MTRLTSRAGLTAEFDRDGGFRMLDTPGTDATFANTSVRTFSALDVDDITFTFAQTTSHTYASKNYATARKPGWWLTEDHYIDMGDGQQRKFLIHTPPDFDASESYSVVFMYHGTGSAGEVTMLNTRVGKAADAENFIVVFPQAENGIWDFGFDTLTGSAVTEDLEFTMAIQDILVSDYGATDFFAAGMSRGGAFVQFMAMLEPDLFEAYMSVSANIPTRAFGQDLTTLEAVNMLTMHGTADDIVPFEGGDLASVLEGGAYRTLMSADETAEVWADASGDTFGSFMAVPDTVNDGTTTRYRETADGSVQQWVVENGGHNWPGQVSYDGSNTGMVSHDIDATAVMVDFFAQFGL